MCAFVQFVCVTVYLYISCLTFMMRLVYVGNSGWLCGHGAIAFFSWYVCALTREWVMACICSVVVDMCVVFAGCIYGWFRVSS